MEKNTSPLPEDLIQRVKNCLLEYDAEIDHIVDSNQVDYQRAQIIVLTKHLKISETEAKEFLKQRESIEWKTSYKITQTQKIVSGLLEEPLYVDNIPRERDIYDSLVDELTSRFEKFCREHDLDVNLPVSEIFKKKWENEIIHTYQWGTKHIRFWTALILLRPDSHITPRDYFISATGGNPFLS